MVCLPIKSRFCRDVTGGAAFCLMLTGNSIVPRILHYGKIKGTELEQHILLDATMKCGKK